MIKMKNFLLSLKVNYNMRIKKMKNLTVIIKNNLQKKLKKTLLLVKKMIIWMKNINKKFKKQELM